MNRGDTIERIRTRTEPWDIIVIGGGATGVGCALDAASRGYDVLLLEQHDLGKGTSSRSTKLIHGGVRYLKQGNISLVRESLKERGLLIKNAPHVVHKQAFVIPCYSLWQKLFYGTGLKVYDLLSGKYSFGRSRILTVEEALVRTPTIKGEGLTGGVLYYDGQFDDTRLLIDMAATADVKGAAILNYAPVTSLVKNKQDKITGVEFVDRETGETFAITGRSVINAAGIFSDQLRKMANKFAEPVLTYSQGIHLVLDRKFLTGDAAMMIPQTRDGRVLFCTPWLGYVLVGTTDTSVASAELEPTALQAEIHFVLETAGEYLAEKPARSDILSVFAGIRPLVKQDDISRTSSISRGHLRLVDSSGLVTITGGKWTTYRKMAEDAVDSAAIVGGLEVKPSLTQDLPIKGSNEKPPPGGDLLHTDLPYTANDVVNAVRNEMAQTVEDVLARRTRALFLNVAAAIEIAPEVAWIMAGELNLSENWISDKIAEFETTARAYSVEITSSP